MKKVLLILVFAAAAAGAIWYSRKDKEMAQQVPQTGEPVQYVCQSGRRFTAAYGDGIAVVTMENTVTYTLELKSAGDETKYANEGDAVVLWVRDGSAFIEEGGATTFAACRQQE